MLHLLIWLQGGSSCIYKDAHSTSSILTPRFSSWVFPNLDDIPPVHPKLSHRLPSKITTSDHVVDAMAAPGLRPPRGSDCCMVRQHRLNSSLLPCAARRCTKRPGRVQRSPTGWDLIVTYSYWMLLVAIVKMLMFDLGEIDLAESGLLETCPTILARNENSGQ